MSRMTRKMLSPDGKDPADGAALIIALGIVGLAIGELLYEGAVWLWHVIQTLPICWHF